MACVNNIAEPLENDKNKGEGNRSLPFGNDGDFDNFKDSNVDYSVLYFRQRKAYDYLRGMH